MQLRPSEICYSQDSVSNTFDQRSRHSGTLIGETLDAICEGRCSVYDIPTITVVQRQGKWVTCDNRRLWVFRHLERLGKCEEITVHVSSYIPVAKLTSCNGGQDIYVRRNAGGRWRNKPSKRQEPIRKLTPDRKIYDANVPVHRSNTPSRPLSNISNSSLNRDFGFRREASLNKDAHVGFTPGVRHTVKTKEVYSPFGYTVNHSSSTKSPAESFTQRPDIQSGHNYKTHLNTLPSTPTSPTHVAQPFYHGSNMGTSPRTYSGTMGNLYGAAQHASVEKHTTAPQILKEHFKQSSNQNSHSPTTSNSTYNDINVSRNTSTKKTVNDDFNLQPTLTSTTRPARPEQASGGSRASERHEHISIEIEQPTRNSLGVVPSQGHNVPDEHKHNPCCIIL